MAAVTQQQQQQAQVAVTSISSANSGSSSNYPVPYASNQFPFFIDVPILCGAQQEPMATNAEASFTANLTAGPGYATWSQGYPYVKIRGLSYQWANLDTVAERTLRIHMGCTHSTRLPAAQTIAAIQACLSNPTPVLCQPATKCSRVANAGANDVALVYQRAIPPAASGEMDFRALDCIPYVKHPLGSTNVPSFIGVVQFLGTSAVPASGQRCLLTLEVLLERSMSDF